MNENLLIETGKVVSVEPDFLWVETIQKSSCGSCEVRSGCGQSVLASLVEKSSYLRVLLNGLSADDFHPGSMVKIGIPASSVVKGSLITYLTPVITLLLASIVGAQLFTHEVLLTLSGVLGFLLGGTFVYFFNQKIKYDKRYQPIVVGDLQQDCINIANE